LQQGHAVGKTHDAIDNAGVEANTIVIYMSDNGAVLIAAPAEYRCGANGSKYVKLG